MRDCLRVLSAAVAACAAWLVMAGGVVHAAQASVAVSGTVVDVSGGAVAGAVVIVTPVSGSARSASTTTDADGRFSLDAASSGAAVVEVTKSGFAPERIEVATVERVGPLRLVLRVAPVSESVEVTARAEAAYSPRSSAAATRTNANVDTIPQSIVTVPRSLIDDQGLQTLSSALRNVSNITALDDRDVNNVGFKIRGFNSAAVVDGVAMPGYFPGQESLFAVQRIDVVKGPTGSLFGSGQGGGYANLGGTIAITTAAPVATAVRSVAARVGSFGDRGVAFDVNQPLGESVAVRLVADVSNTDSETSGVFFRRRALFPSLSWHRGAATSVTVRVRYLDNATADYSGLPTRGTLDTRPFALPRSTGIIARDVPDTRNRSRGVNLQASHALNGRWTASLIAASNRATVDQRGAWLVDAASPIGCFDFGTVQALFNVMCGARLWDQFHTTTVSPALTGVISAGRATHTVSFGVDHERTSDDAFMSYSNLFGPVSFAPVSLLAPVYPTWSEPLEPTTPDQQNRYVATVVYAQEQFDRGALHLLGSLRFSSIDVTDVNPIFGVNNTSTNRKVTPRAGLVYDVAPGVAAFVGVSAGTKVPTGSIFATPPKPEESRQTEVGLRTREVRGLTATVAWFDLSRRNVAIADRANPGYSVQVGEQRSRGIDADLRWAVGPGWTLLGALTRQSPEIVDGGSVALNGSQLFNVPKVTMRLAGRYDASTGPLTGFGAGLGVTHHSELPGNSFNTFFTPAATLWDAQVSYGKGRVRLGLNASNLTDHLYFVPSNYFGGNQVIPALRRVVSATLRVAM